jgi:hypothetical protein
MVGLIIVQLIMILLFLCLGWLILTKKAYYLISGFASRPKEEQEELIQNGSLQNTGKLLFATGVGMLVLLPLHLTSFAYTMEVQFGFMLVFLLGGTVYLSKYEVARKRKRSYLISSSLFIVTIGFVVGLYIFGTQDYEIKFTDETFEITGMYGDKWNLSTIQSVKLLDEMPPVTRKNNGFGLSTLAKGKFTVEGYGNSLLFVRKQSSPYVYIELSDENIFLNGETPEETKEWYEQLKTSE